MKKKETLNLASYYASASALRVMSPAMASKLAKVKKQRRKRRKRRNNRNYLPDCPGEYLQLKESREPKLFPWVAEIAPRCSRDVFRITPDNNPPMTREQGFNVIRAKFLKWAKARNIAGPWRFHVVPDNGTLRFLVELSPDMKITVTRAAGMA